MVTLTDHDDELRRTLGTALVKGGYSGVLFADDHDLNPKRDPRLLGGLILTVQTLPVGIAVWQLLGLPLLLAALITLIAFAAIVFLIATWDNFVWVNILLWLLGLALVIALAGWGAAFITFGLPVLFALLVAAVRLVNRMLSGLDPWGLVRSSPLLFPVVILLLFIPLLSTEVWQAAGDATTTQLLLLPVLILLPVSAFLYGRLAGSVAVICNREAHEIAREGDPGPTIDEVTRLLDHGRGRWVRYFANAQVAARLDGAEFAPYVSAILRSLLRRRLALALTFVLLGGALLLFAYIYLLAVLTVQTGLAASWSEQSVPLLEISRLGANINLPGGPYLKATALLTTLALGAFLALMLTEERYSNTLAEALINRPIRAMLVLALPYLSLGEQVALREQVEAPPQSPPELPTQSASPAGPGPASISHPPPPTQPA